MTVALWDFAGKSFKVGDTVLVALGDEILEAVVKATDSREVVVKTLWGFKVVEGEAVERRAEYGNHMNLVAFRFKGVARRGLSLDMPLPIR